MSARRAARVDQGYRWPYLHPVPKLTPADSLWLAVLDSEPALRGLQPDQLRRQLERGGFPERIIKVFLAKHQALRTPPKKAANAR